MTRPPIHPGELLAEELVFLDMTTSALARELEIPVSQLAAIVNDEQGNTTDIAMRLSGWLGTRPDLWLNLQLRYEQRQAEAGSAV